MYDNYKNSELTEEIIGIFYHVYKTLGFGFLEKVYENSMMIMLKKAGFDCLSQKPIKVYFDNEIVGEYFADIVVEEKVIIELKAVNKLSSVHEVQLVNYLKATGIEVGLLLNFGSKPEVRRRVFSKDYSE